MKNPRAKPRKIWERFPTLEACNEKVSPETITKLKYHYLGYAIETVEKKVPYGFISQDLYGWQDLQALGKGECIGIQVTTYSNHAARRNKMLLLRSLRDWLEVPGHKALLLSWKFTPNEGVETKGRWEHKEEWFTLESISLAQIA